MFSESTASGVSPNLPANRADVRAVLAALTGSATDADNLMAGRMPGVTITGSNMLAAARLSGGRSQLAQAASVSGTPSMPVPFQRLHGSVERVAGGALRMGNTIFTAAQLMQEIQDANERAQVREAIRRFSLDGAQAVDVLAARAYVWGRYMAPMAYWNVPYSGQVNESVAAALMRHERDNPGTLGMATRGNAAARKSIDIVIAQATAGVIPMVPMEPVYRASAVDRKLSTTSPRARALLGIAANLSWRAHHLLPFAVVASLPTPVQLAMANAGWYMDSLENLIALPANEPTYFTPLNTPKVPIHNGAHPLYSSDVRLQMAVLTSVGATMQPAALRSELSRLELYFRQQLFINIQRYHIFLR
jgi:A nuclease family of the HNH/ENDO VII superfamily with conserved AHH